MDSPQEKEKPSSVFELAAKMVVIETLLNDARKQSRLSVDVMEKQNEMLEILIDVIDAIAKDGDAPMNIRRRLTFALKQIAGIRLPS